MTNAKTKASQLINSRGVGGGYPYGREIVEHLERRGLTIVDHEQLRRVLRRSRQQTHEARQDAKRWREHVAAIKASGREPAGIMADQEGQTDCVYYKAGTPSGDCGGDGHFMCAACAKRVAG